MNSRKFATRPARRARAYLGASSALALAVALAVALASGGLAHAETDSGSGAVKEVVVTGSRIARSTFTTPNPVTVMNGKDIQKLGLTDVGSVLAELPQNSTFYTPANQAGSNFNIGASFANLRGLNPYFGTRTLTLVDGRRVVPTSTGGAVDLGIIPSMLVQRVETVTGGASAAYGSDAVAGVVNVILDTSLEGFKGQVDYGQTFQGDGGDFHVSGAYGTGFAGGKGHVVIGGEYEKANAIGACSIARDWCASNYALFQNAGFAGTPANALYPGSPAIPPNGAPEYIVGPNAKVTGATIPGVLSYDPFGAAPLGQFNTAGTATGAFNPGVYGSVFPSTAPRQGGDGDGVGLYDATPLRPEVKHYSLFTHADLDLNDRTQAFVEGSFSRRNSVTTQAATGAPLFTLIAPDNIFLPAATAAAMPTGAFFFRSGNDLPPQTNTTQEDTWRVAAGLKGDLFGGWTWDAYYQYGRHKGDSTVDNVLASGFYGFALDAVANTNPALGTVGAPICRQVLLGNPAATGCVPLNLFGKGNADPAALAYAYQTLPDHVVNDQHVAAFNTRGDLFEGWGAGPIRGAAGVEYRHESISDTHDLAHTPAYYQFAINYGDEYAGKSDVVEGYAEINVPVLKDLPLAKSFELDAAIRETRNKTSGAGASHTVDFTSWKVSGVWDMNDWLRVRATRSRDVRAPSFQQLYSAFVFPPGLFGAVFNPLNPTAADAPGFKAGANPSLNPETANTTTAGVVLSPGGFLSGLHASADWYQIALKGAIGELPAGTGSPLQAVINTCFTYGVHCDLINNGAGLSTAPITQIDDLNINLGSYTTRGVDAELDYDLPLDRVGKAWSGDLNFRMVASYIYDMIIDTGVPGAPVANYAGQSGPPPNFGSYNSSPKWQVNSFLTYSNGPFSGTVQVRYVGPGRLLTLDGSGAPVFTCATAACASTPGSINDNHVASAFYVNLAASYQLTKSIEVFGRVDNLFDKAPPVDAGLPASYPTNAALFDTFGVTWKTGVRLRY